MEALYTALQGEIRSFKEHMRSCQQAFDIHTLYNVLLLLPRDGGRREIQSLEQLETLAESRGWDGKDFVRITAGHKKSDIPSYISWFVSYVRYLGSLKEAFDANVVLPLCENLYINDDPPPLGMLPSGGSEGHATASVAHTAKQLFDLRRKWALLLKGGMIDEQVFSYQSLLDLQGFANIHPFVRIMRLVPDIFHKSLASAELAQQWVELHASSAYQVCSDSSLVRKGYDTGMAVGSLGHQPGLPQYQHNRRGGWPQSKARSISGRDACTGPTIQGRNKLHEVHGKLMSLLWREERSWMLEAEIQKVNQRISNLQIQGEDKEKDLEALEHQLEKDDWRTLTTQHQIVLHELEALERQLRLEEYRKNILQGDWLLELEVRPVLLRQIHTLQERCQELARVLQGREEAPKDLPQRANGPDSHSSHSSGGSDHIEF
ncbi:uncharacterized protein LOC132589712 [Heteronotia binoei]|uniref:uncharacterized protein LOC132589712 n=1 Tax=Heteronotia binoei TaxID=13085 RepID=UPI00292E28D1|nr:uncharacterized protein LOC132589712 [Heteronotia binoei]